jgi:hypothetical protein
MSSGGQFCVSPDNGTQPISKASERGLSRGSDITRATAIRHRSPSLGQDTQHPGRKVGPLLPPSRVRILAGEICKTFNPFTDSIYWLIVPPRRTA